MEQSGLRIGEVAAHTGVSIDTLRYYERRHLLPQSARTAGGFRLFTPEAVERVMFIKQAQALGFSLDEIAQLLTTGGRPVCRRVRNLLSTKLQELDKRIKAMREFRRALVRHLARCERELMAHGTAARCPLVKIKAADQSPKEDLL